MCVCVYQIPTVALKWNSKDCIVDTEYLHIIPGKIVSKTISKIYGFKINWFQNIVIEGTAVMHGVAQSCLYSPWSRLTISK